MSLRQTGIRLSSFAAMCAATILAFPTAIHAATETFVPTTIHYPGAVSTFARGINNSGDVVGTFVCGSSGCPTQLPNVVVPAGTHGFLLQDDVYLRIDVPGGTNTFARGISDQGIIVGHYVVAGVTHGFVYSDGEYVYPIDVPAEMFDHPASTSRQSMPIRISPQGDIVGCFHEDNMQMTTMHGWRLHHGVFTILKTPHEDDAESRDPDTMTNGISPTGDIVGFYLSDGVSYVASQDRIVTTFTFDGRFTLAWDVNARGDVVGVVGDNQAMTVGQAINPRGFLRTKDGQYRELHVEGSSVTQVNGINARRDIVGQYTVAGVSRGFVYRLSRGN